VTQRVWADLALQLGQTDGFLESRLDGFRWLPVELDKMLFRYPFIMPATKINEKTRR
jgi:hypothetical protein